MRTKIFNVLRTSALVVALSAGVSVVYAWTAPTAAPTGGNAAAPINVSSTAQVKNGTLQVTGLGAGIAPSAIYGVNGISSAAGGAGLFGYNASGNGVLGQGSYSGVSGLDTGTGEGVFGQGRIGGYFYGTGYHGVQGNTGTQGYAGVYGTGATYGVRGESTGAGYGVYGLSAGGATGVYGDGGTGVGVYGTGGQMGVSGAGNYAVVGSSPGNAIGVWGISQSAGVGVQGQASTGTGVYGMGQYGVYANGSVYDFMGQGGEWGRAGTWSNGSSRSLKENFVPVNNQSILAKIVALPMTQWNYKTDKKALHIGPIAEDFYAIFGLGNDEKSVSTIDPAGVALVGVKALNEKIDAQQKEIDELKAEIRALRK